MNAIPISTLKPSDTEIDEARAFQRNEFADSCSFGDVHEAMDEMLSEEDKSLLVELVQQARRNRLNGISGGMTEYTIGITVVTAFIAHVNKYAEPNVNAYLDGYADRQAEELRERGVLVAHKGWLNDEPMTKGEKLERARGYLNARHINRGDARNCQHQYTRAEETDIGARMNGFEVRT